MTLPSLPFPDINFYQMTATATYADLAELVSTIRKPETSSSEVSLFPEDDEDEMFDFGEEEEEDAAEFSEGREEGKLSYQDFQN